jgi:hypothetical protein
MKQIPSGRIQKIVAISAIALIITLIFGFAVSGLNDNSQINENQNSSQIPEDPKEPEEPLEDEPPAQTLPPEIVYINYLTGLVTTEKKYQSRPYVYSMTSSAPFYAISGADLVIEVPVENKETRLLVYTQNSTEAEKIGAIAPTRDYISWLTKAFGGLLIANGCDDIVEYNAPVSSIPLDLSKNSIYSFIENAKHMYTTGTLISDFTKNEKIDLSAIRKPNMPFTFAEEGYEVSGKTSAKKITVPYDSAKNTTLVYDSAKGEYLYVKSGVAAVDMLNGENCYFENVFVLFADATTYEKAEGVEMVMETYGEGKGYYATGGKLVEIKWRLTDSGELVFEDLSSEQIVVNPGNSYIGFYKSSDSMSVSFE